jgi:hypothetical protein
MNGEQATVAVVEALEDLGIPYMLVGSFSTNFYGIARATQDADIVIQLGDVTLQALKKRLGANFQIDMQISFETATGTKRNVVQVAETNFKIELFRLSLDAHDQERFARRRQLFSQQLNHATFLPSVEDVIIFKLRWAVEAGRTKDREDVRDVIAVQMGQFDWDYVHRWTHEHGTQSCLDEIINSIPVDLLPPDTHLQS